MTRDKMADIILVESETVPGAYDMPTTRAIIEHPKYGRVYLTEMFAGQGSMSGGAPRWRHGVANRLQPGDTLESLKTTQINPWTTVLQAMQEGMDPARPWLNWSGEAIERVAAAAGL